MKTSPLEYKARLEEIQNGNTVSRVTLPSDEPRFIINTNKRTITVPEDFVFLGVLRDNGAETIYFEIDRYFDHEDLAAHTCIIQFNVIKDEEELAEGICPVTELDVDSLPGKIIFGWKISSEVTQYEGDVFFSVRFYSVQNGIMTYSFNTLAADLPIERTLDVTEHYMRRYPALFEEWNSRMMELHAEVVENVAKMEAMAAEMNEAVEVANNPPKLSDDGSWMVWDAENDVYVDTGVQAEGRDGGFYIPSVADGMLIFTPSEEGMPEVAPIALPNSGGSGNGTFAGATGIGAGLAVNEDGNLIVATTDEITEGSSLPVSSGAVFSTLGVVDDVLESI